MAGGPLGHIVAELRKRERGGLDFRGTMGCYAMRFLKLNLMLFVGL